MASQYYAQVKYLQLFVSEMTIELDQLKDWFNKKNYL